MKKKVVALTVAAVVAALSAVVHAESNLGKSFKLSCDADGFENPMIISAKDGNATVVASWDVGPDIASAHYSKLEVISLNGETDISQPRTPEQSESIYISLKLNNHGKYTGRFSIVSTDGDQLSNSGSLECTVK